MPVMTDRCWKSSLIGIVWDGRETALTEPLLQHLCREIIVSCNILYIQNLKCVAICIRKMMRVVREHRQLELTKQQTIFRFLDTDLSFLYPTLEYRNPSSDPDELSALS